MANRMNYQSAGALANGRAQSEMTKDSTEGTVLTQKKMISFLPVLNPLGPGLGNVA